MNFSKSAMTALVGLALTMIGIGGAIAAPPLQQFESTGIKTMTGSTEITIENQGELQKISGDIALAYRLHRGSMQYMQPGKLRVESSIPLLGSGYYVVNGNRKLVVAPFVHKVQDITGAPGKKQTLLDFGLVPPELFDDYNATFLRRDGADLVYQVSPKLPSETYKYIIWVNPQTKITEKRVDYDRHGKETKFELYKGAAEYAPGIYIPTSIELYNTENKLAGATVYQQIKVNQPLNASLFNI